MSADENTEVIEEKKTENKIISNVKLDKRFAIVAVVLVLSLSAVVFSTRYLFSSDFDDWSKSQGSFEAKNGVLSAQNIYRNYLFHDSEVAYGSWEWRLTYYGSGSAAITFIGLDQNPNNLDLCEKGYQLVFEVGKNVSLNRLDGGINSQYLSGVYFPVKPQTSYSVKITRAQNDTFAVYLDNVLQFTAVDSSYNSSEVFELRWENKQKLEFVRVIDSEGQYSWADYFSGLPSAYSNNFFTKVSLYLPFVTLALIIIFYILRIAFSDGNWRRLAFPLMLSIALGFGWGLLAEWVRDNIPTFEEETTTDPESSSPSDPSSNTNSSNGGPSTDPSNDTTPNLNSTTSPVGGAEPFTGLPKEPISIALLSVSGVFTIVAVVFVAVDFFRKRDDEFHEKIFRGDKRWIPTAAPTDHRKRVIKAYHEASYDLIDKGAKSLRSMTPGEFQESTIEKLSLGEESIAGLTDLYEEARFSEHKISSIKSKEAERYYKLINDELKARSLAEAQSDSSSEVPSTSEESVISEEKDAKTTKDSTEEKKSKEEEEDG